MLALLTQIGSLTWSPSPSELSQHQLSNSSTWSPSPSTWSPSLSELSHHLRKRALHHPAATSIDPAAYNTNHLDAGDAKIYLRADAEYIYLAMEAHAGYVAGGLYPSLNPQMDGADIVVCGDYEGTLQAVDYHGIGFVKPEVDTIQDWQVTSIGRANGVTTCEVRRLRTTCDAEHDMQIHDPSAVISILLAWGADPTSSELHFHGPNRRTQFLTFEETEEIAAPIGETTHVLSITAPDVVVPQLQGTEICTYHILPAPYDASQLYHITKVTTTWEATDTNGQPTADDQGLAHHITLLACPAHPSWQDGAFIPSCNDGFAHCTAELVGQAVNIKGDEGIPFGNGVAVAVVFLRHFYNQNYLQDVVDHGTTFALEFTPDLRPYSLGRIVMQTTSLVVPSFTMDHHTQVICPSDCTERNGAVHISAVSFHMHDRGNSDARAAILHHIRGGQELPIVYEQSNFIEGVTEGWFQVDVELQPGDTLLFECIYDNPSAVTERWGAGFYDQMCVASMDVRSAGVLAMNNCIDSSDGSNPAVPFSANCPSVLPDPNEPTATLPAQLHYTAEQRQAFLSFSPYVRAGGDCPPAPPTSPPAWLIDGTGHCDLLLSGHSCANGYNEGLSLNQVYRMWGFTADGRPYFRGETEATYLFYDSACQPGDDPAWYLGCRAPSLTATSNLQVASPEQGCCNHGNVRIHDTQLSTTPLGQHSWWRWCGSPETSGTQTFTLQCVDPSPLPPLPLPPPPQPPAAQPSPPPPPPPPLPPSTCELSSEQRSRRCVCQYTWVPGNTMPTGLQTYCE